MGKKIEDKKLVDWGREIPRKGEESGILDKDQEAEEERGMKRSNEARGKYRGRVGK